MKFIISVKVKSLWYLELELERSVREWSSHLRGSPTHSFQLYPKTNGSKSNHLKGIRV